MNNKNSLFKHFDFLLVDLISLVFSFSIAYFIRSFKVDFVKNISYLNILLWMLIPNIIYYILTNPYNDILRRSDVEEVKLSINHVIINFLFVSSLMYILKSGVLFSRLVVGYTYIIYFLISVIFRIIWKRYIQKRVSRLKTENKSSLLVVSKKENIVDVLYNLANTDYGKYAVKGIFLTNANDIDVKGHKVIKIDELYDYVITNNINVVFVTTNVNSKTNNVIKKLISEGIEVQIYIDGLLGVEAEAKDVGNVGMYNTLVLNSYTFSTTQRMYFVLKRLLDILFSIIGCILLIPTYALIKLMFLFSGDKEPIVYTQERIGLNGAPFNLYKFRSMIPNADEVLKELLKDEKIKKEWDKNQKLENDPRITKVGNILRKTSIDELPQFINVLKGEMSLIGPRPLVKGELQSKGGIKLYERVRPGITGWWACNGRSDMSYEERLEHEYYYVRNCSLYLDVLTVLRTIYVVLFRKGAK